jgi:hypothetical protein
MLQIYDLREQMSCLYSSLYYINSTVLRRRFFEFLIQQLVSELNYLTQTAKSDETEQKDFHQIWNCKSDIDLRLENHFGV